MDTNNVKLMCYICNTSLNGTDTYDHLFDARINDCGNVGSSLADIFCGMLGEMLTEESPDPEVVCPDCKEILLTYESYQLQCNELRTHILKAYSAKMRTNESVDIAYDPFEDDTVSNLVVVDVQRTKNKSANNTSKNIVKKEETSENDIIVSCDSSQLAEVFVEEENCSVTKSEASDSEEALDNVLDVADMFKQIVKNEFIKETQFTCINCTKNFTNEELFHEHCNNVCKLHQCSTCTKYFASRHGLSMHMKIHKERERLTCTHCNKRFKSRQALSAHRKSLAEGKGYVCEICDKAFSAQHNLNLHKLTHTDHRPFVCSFCGKSFLRRPELHNHERIHTGERPFKCAECDAAFAQRSNLMSHINNTHLNVRPQKCELCGKGFKRKRMLDYHMKSVHTGERPIQCELCDATFITTSHYKKHLLIHTGAKPYDCEICSKSFSNRENRNVHRFIHSNKKPYECLECGEGYMRKMQLLAHMKSANHLNDMIIINQPKIVNGELIMVAEKNEAKSK